MRFSVVTAGGPQRMQQLRLNEVARGLRAPALNDQAPFRETIQLGVQVASARQFERGGQLLGDKRLTASQQSERDALALLEFMEFTGFGDEGQYLPVRRGTRKGLPAPGPALRRR